MSEHEMTIQERRIATLRISRVSHHLTSDMLAHVSKDEHVHLGIIAEFVLCGFLKPVHVDGVKRWAWTPAATMALNTFEPRKGKHE